MTRADRALTVRRALMTTPFLTRLDFELSRTQARNTQLSAQKVPINNNFFLTEIVGNFGEVRDAVSAYCDLSVWTMYEQSVYRFDTAQLLPTGFLTTEARFRAPSGAREFDDRQREFMPFEVRDGDSLFAQVRPVTAPTDDYTATVVLKGYNVLPNTYVDANTTEVCNASLDREARFEFFKFNVIENSKKVYTLENDSFPRLLLGFGVTNDTADKNQVSGATVLIKDATRRLAFSETAIPIDFLAPRLVCSLDARIYYLPIEYYLEPFAKLQFEIDNVYADQPHGFEFNALTRTV